MGANIHKRCESTTPLIKNVLIAADHTCLDYDIFDKGFRKVFKP
mgnify:CR=1 FL=1